MIDSIWSRVDEPDPLDWIGTHPCTIHSRALPAK